jgi:hypothetical protein
LNEPLVPAYNEQEAIAMKKLLCLALTLSAAAAPAFAQHWGGSGSSSHTARPAQSQPAAVHPATVTLIDGRQPLWGGSPPATRNDRRAHQTIVVPYYVVPTAVAAQEPVAAPVTVDTVYAAAAASSYQMPVITANRAPRELTTIEVYRLQPRFRKP